MANKQLQYAYCPINQEVKHRQSGNKIWSVNRI